MAGGKRQLLFQLVDKIATQFQRPADIFVVLQTVQVIVYTSIRTGSGHFKTSAVKWELAKNKTSSLLVNITEMKFQI